MKVCVLQPDYSTTDVDYKNYDPPRNLAGLLPADEVDHVFLNKLTCYRQLKELAKKNYDIFVNLCEGYLEWEIPSIDVIYFLELLNLPFTGPTSALYDPPKDLMKYVAYTQNVSTPPFATIETLSEIDSACNHLQYPLFIKPVKAGDSLGINNDSLINDSFALKNRAQEIISEYGPLLVEEFVNGREFTVMVLANDKDDITILKPVEYIFKDHRNFKTYASKTSELHPDSNIALADDELCNRLTDAAGMIFKGFGGVGYARLDFRMNAQGQIFFLEINFTCSVFYTAGFEGSADYILKLNGVGQNQFLKTIIAEGIARFRNKKKKYVMKGNAIAGFGIYAAADINEREVIFRGEEQPQRIATRSHIFKTWDKKNLENFRKYAYPLSKELYLLWDEDPARWAPQNHSCDANCYYVGLNVCANRIIKKGEELTLDYASFLDHNMEPFDCKCGSTNCRGFIMARDGNSISGRESGLNS